ncbi:uncharacterized protein [Solanum tuberosum]|uniref:uncharacterized protein n=1 Tax=Solanum tuberosum TaxID=4113 RepID=UPI00073A48DD|nr:PREDICTED: uncharacterized protein LOC107058796 [Solanum tuberosum]
MVTPEQNMTLQAMPTSEELQQVVFSMNPNSAPGPDGFCVKFFQSCWGIIKEDILNAVHAFFCGSFMPKFISHASLVLLRKVDHPNNFSEFRPISLSNLTNKIIEEFNNVVKAYWDREVEGNPMWRLQQKMKRLTATPSNWSRTTYGDIFSIVRDHEERVRVAEEALIVNNSTENRANLHMINARYIKYLKLEDSILKQKTQLQWFKDGDTNSKYFFAIMRGRRRILFIHKVCIGNEEWVEGYENIAKAACDHFKNIFTGTEQPINEDILQHIPRMVTPEQNMTLQAMPTSEELQQVVFSMNPNSAPGPDGFCVKFFQSCWGIIKEDILNAVHAFFCGSFMPKGRSISESVMLAQEIIHGIKKPKEGDNVVIKLDMAKAYERLSWAFTSLVLRHMGFGEIFIDIVWRIMRNNWYSNIVNGTSHGFFHSTRGLKQGDPLSPSLFILGAEALSRMPNNLYDNQHFHGFQMDFRRPQINHLSFAHDVIIFTSGREESLKLIMETLSTYEDTSDQLINKGKSHFMVPKDTPSHIIDMIQEITGFNQSESPINYLGCPLYIGTKDYLLFRFGGKGCQIDQWLALSNPKFWWEMYIG